MASGTRLRPCRLPPVLLLVLVVVGAAVLMWWVRLGIASSALITRISSEMASADERELINIPAMTAFEWDILHVFPPYSSATQIEDSLGFPSSLARTTGISSSDGHYLLVFTRSGRVVRHAMLPRTHGDFGITNWQSGNSFSAQDAVFVYSSAGDDEERGVLYPIRTRLPSDASGTREEVRSQ